MLDRIAVADAAAELKRNFYRGDDLANRWRIHRSSRERAVEIDKMQIFETRRFKCARLRSGIIVEHCRLRHVALPQAHATSILQIDRGKNNHADILTAAISKTVART